MPFKNPEQPDLDVTCCHLKTYYNVRVVITTLQTKSRLLLPNGNNWAGIGNFCRYSLN